MRCDRSELNQSAVVETNSISLYLSISSQVDKKITKTRKLPQYGKQRRNIPNSYSKKELNQQKKKPEKTQSHSFFSMLLILCNYFYASLRLDRVLSHKRKREKVNQDQHY